MKSFCGNLAFWALVAVSTVIVVTLIGHASAHVPPWLTDIIPFGLFLLIYWLLLMFRRRQRLSEAIARADAFAERSHEQADQIIMLLGQIRDQLAATRSRT